MTKFDFTTLVDRWDQGSDKWEAMKKANPAVGHGIVPFSVADMELKNPPQVVEGLKRFLDTSILGYTQATEPYYDAVVQWMEKRHNWKIEKDWIVYAPGVVTALFAAVDSVIKPGDGVIILTPVYYPFSRSILKAKGRIVECPLINENGMYRIDFDALKNACEDPNNKMIIFCSPHNPVGRVWSEEELRRVGELCTEKGVVIVSDEIHFDLIMPGCKHTVFATLSDTFAQNMIVCTSPSKTFNLAGMQTSNIIIPNPQLRNKFTETLHYHTSSHLNAMGYEACRIAYTECEEWLDELLTVLKDNEQKVRSFMNEVFPEVVVSPLQGTYLLWLDFRKLGLTREELEHKMVFDALWFTDEGYVFGELGSGFERINLACPGWVLDDALLRLKKAFGR